MIFKQIPEVLDGRKTQTRRLVREGETVTSYLKTLIKLDNYVDVRNTVSEVRSPNGRRRFYVGQKSPIIPKQGQPAVRVNGVIQYVKITRIEQERLQCIMPEEAMHEGMWQRADECWTTSICEPSADCFSSPIGAYARLWDSINTKPGTRWEDNPLVWVIVFGRWGDDR